MKVHLLIIDPQIDFCRKDGALFVPGATEDMTRGAAMILRLLYKIDDIHITFDSHRLVDISHGIWWKDSAGNHPPPFTLITAADMKSGRWTTTKAGAFDRSLAYLEELEKRGRYTHCIWPPHCIIGDEGHNILPVLSDAVHEWERKRFALADVVTKGSNPFTEHFSAVKAEVDDPEDPSTQVNTPLVETLAEADMVILMGEAGSHCLAWTARDILAMFGPEAASKLVILTDATSPVPDPPNTTLFTDAYQEFLDEWVAAGAKTSTTTDILS